MIRFFIISFSLLCTSATSLHGMERPGIPDTDIKAIGRDVLRGGLIVPALIAIGAASLAVRFSSPVFSTNIDGNVTIVADSFAKIVMVGWVMYIPIFGRILGHIDQVRPHALSDRAREVRSLFRFLYGALAWYCIDNAREILAFF